MTNICGITFGSLLYFNLYINVPNIGRMTYDCPSHTRGVCPCGLVSHIGGIEHAQRVYIWQSRDLFRHISHTVQVYDGPALTGDVTQLATHYHHVAYRRAGVLASRLGPLTAEHAVASAGVVVSRWPFSSHG